MTARAPAVKSWSTSFWLHGVRHAFCVPGESYLAALDAFHDRDIALTVCRHESSAAMAAEAIGKATGRPGICFVTRGPGATNASLGIHIARQDSTPLIVFVGQVARSMREREAFQEIDYRAVFGSVAKWATEIDDPARIPELVSRAFHTACNGRPGPVVIALPEDMLSERVAVPDARAFEPVETWPGLTDMSRLQKMLWAAKRPVALVGGSRWSEPACAALRCALPSASRCPSPPPSGAAHLFDALHPCYAGDFGIGPNPKLHARVRGADLVLLIGGRLSEMSSQSYTLLDIPEPQMKLVHVHPWRRGTRPRLSPGAGDPGFAHRLLLGARGPAAAERNSPGAARAKPRMPTISPGPKRRRRSRAASISARSWRGCATICRRTPSSPTAPAISPPGSTASIASANTIRTSPAPPARWVTAFRRRSASRRSIPSAPWCALPATAIS